MTNLEKLNQLSMGAGVNFNREDIFEFRNKNDLLSMDTIDKFDRVITYYSCHKNKYQDFKVFIKLWNLLTEVKSVVKR